jgi:Tol biopolymer transport system component
MTLSQGTRLGHYEILAPIAAGGMGEVYRGRDVRLDRTVAIKVLPQDLAQDPNMRQRFEREARTVSALNHPHICVLHDVGQQETDEGSTFYLVMEYVDGESLGDRLARGPLPVDLALRVGTEIADALEKAHRSGVTHRDLKPRNVVLGKSGAKLLDFGLAKLRPPDPEKELSEAETRARPITSEGALIGTFEYMAPEQLEGKEADPRTDIFALGTLLYEMTTGRRPFRASSQASLITAIMSSEPAPISSLQPRSPLMLDRVVRTCLEKDPEDRWQNAGDVEKELQWILREPQSLGPRRRRGWREGLAWGLVAGLGLVVLGALPLLRRAPVRPTTRVTVLAPEGTVIDQGFAVAPDGRSVALAATDEKGGSAIWLRSLAGADPTKLPGTEDGRLPFWSPDGQHLGFFTRDKVKRIDANGGALRTICNLGGGSPRGGSWSKAGSILFSPGPGRPLLRVSSEGGPPVEATKLSDATGTWWTQEWPWFLPDGQHFLYIAAASHAQGTPYAYIYVGSLEGGEAVRLLQAPGAYPVAYSENGYLLYVRQGLGLVAHRFDPRANRLDGEPIPVSGALGENAMYQWAQYSASNDTLVLGEAPSGLGLELTWFDRAGHELSRIGAHRAYRDAAISPDGRRAVGQLVEEMGVGDLWLLDLQRDVASRLTFHPASHINGTWSPDGTRIAFGSNQEGVYQLFVKGADGVGPEERLLKTDRQDAPTDWSPDGRTIVYEERDPDTNKRDLWLLDMAGGSKAAPYLQSPFDKFQAQFSPDGKWMAYGSDESGRWEIYVQAIPASGGKWQISNSGGTQPRWRRDGQEIFYLSVDEKIMSVGVTLRPHPEFGLPKALFPVRIVQNAFGTDEFFPTSDGARFLTTNAVEPPGPSAPTGGGLKSLGLVLDWVKDVATH